MVTARGQIDLGIALDAPPPAVDPVSVVFTLDSSSEDSVVVAARLNMPAHVHVYAAESLFFRFAVTSFAGLSAPVYELPEPSVFHNYDSTSVPVFTGGQVLRVRCGKRADTWRLAGRLRYQACDNSMCFIPKTHEFAFGDGADAGAAAAHDTGDSGAGHWRELLEEFEQTGSVGGYQSAERFAAFLADPGTQPVSGLAGRSLVMILALLLLGGFLLNLTPCVLPMLPITLAVIGAGAQARSKLRGLLVGGVYAAGMTLAYGVAGAAVVASGATFGVVNSSPVFNLAMAVVFAALALAMFEVLHVDLSRFRSGLRPGGSGGKLVGAFVLGALTAVLAGACVAPVVISVVVYATDLYARGQPLALLLPFVLGLGMALPWPFAGAGMAFLPKPGAWMAWVRNLFGVAILGVALWYGYTGVRMLLPQDAGSAGAERTDNGLQWHSSLAEGLEWGLAEGKPVLVDFWATWCKNCHVMEATTMRDPAVVEQLLRYVLVKYQAEDPGAEPAASVLKGFGVVGLPTYVVLMPR